MIENVLGSHIILRDSITLKNVKIKLIPPYSIESYIDDETKFSLDLDYIKLANANPIFSDVDKKRIDQSASPHLTYKLLHAFRDLGLTCDSFDEIDLKILKNNINEIVLKQYETQIKYITEDDDLTDSQRDSLVQITDKVLGDYCSLLKKSNSLKVILLNWPNLFAEELQFNGFLISMMHDESLPNNIR